MTAPTQTGRAEVVVVQDINGKFFFAFGCWKRRCSVVGMRHYKTKAAAKRAAQFILRRLA